ncbi:MAG: hypothetical protein IKP65_02950 [Alphaproteobacteria bacterium]|nr:hypothetical protein [Alphaproteobacteria bacterium]
MKIRSNYVSNSSSSSFIIKKFDKEIFENLIDDFIKTLNFNEEYYDYLYFDEESIKKCILDKINQDKKTQEDNFNIYIKEGLDNIFYNMFHYFIYMRNWELSGCKSCENYKEHFNTDKVTCKNCWNYYLYKQAKEHKTEYEINIDDFNEFDFKNEYKEIQKIVYDTPVINNKDEKQVQDNWKEWSDIIDSYIDKYYQLWIEKYPDAYIIDFASDNGDDNEAFLRYNIYKMIDFMNDKNIKGFRGENS